jgi:hypothetical protein
MRSITSHTDRHRSTFVTIVLITAAAILTAYMLKSVYNIGVAHADITVDAGISAVLDAGAAGSGSGSGVAYHDPITHPAEFITDVTRLWHTGGWAVALLLITVGLLEVTAWVGKNLPSLAWLAKGRASIAIGGGLTVAVAALNAAASDGRWAAALSALVAVALAFWHNAGTDPNKA